MGPFVDPANRVLCVSRQLLVFPALLSTRAPVSHVLWFQDSARSYESIFGEVKARLTDVDSRYAYPLRHPVTACDML